MTKRRKLKTFFLNIRNVLMYRNFYGIIWKLHLKKEFPEIHPKKINS